MEKQNRINCIKERMKVNGIDILLIPSEDPHLSEYPAQHWKLRQLISGFTGSNGFLILSKYGDGLWTDSRYYLQAEQELKGTSIHMYKESESSWLSWLEEQPKKSRIGLNGLYFSQNDFESIEKVCQTHQFSLNSNIILPEENDMPSLPLSELFIHDSRFEKRCFQEKKELVFSNCSSEYLLLCSLDEIAWVFNLRASDIDYNPMAIGYGILGKSESYIFLSNPNISNDVKNYFIQNNIHYDYPYESIFDFTHQLSQNKKISVDPQKTNTTLYNRIKKENLIREQSPIEQLKSIKTKDEISSIYNAEKKDGVALTKAYLEIVSKLNDKQRIGEQDVATIFLKHRSAQKDFFCESFSTIAGYGANGAIVHYNSSLGNNTPIGKDNLLLVDSGANYLDGTTDITRVFCFGDPTDQQKRDYTLVLKGHIAIATCKFPYGTEGPHIDALARQHLWKEGLDYGHGTGHGIGFFLCVHEGPQRINRKFNNVKLAEGMVLSDEPGLYRTHQYGIRIENMVVVEKCQETEFGIFLKFNTLTLFPYERKLIDKGMLTTEEIEWINQYHQKVYDELVPLLSSENEKIWLKNATNKL